MSNWQTVKKDWYKLKNGIDLNINGQGIVCLSNAGYALGGNGLKLTGGADMTVSAVDGKEDDGQEYVDYKFRMLSKTYIPGWELDFREENVLQEALPLFATKLTRNHNVAIENFHGKSLNPSWNNSTTPPGIDATYRIYKEFGDDIIKKLNLKILDSTSVGIRFLWKKSHSGMRLWDFLDNLGREVDGQIVRFIITKILSVPEASIVYAGADENAKRLSPKSNQNLNDIINSQGDNMDEIIKLEKQLSEKTSELTELRTKQTNLETENKTLKAENEKLKPLATLGEAQEKSLRADAEKHYRLVSADSVNEDMIKQLQSAPLELVKTLAADFAERAEKLHPAKCPSCKAKLTRQSSALESDTNDTASDDDINMDDYGM